MNWKDYLFAALMYPLCLYVCLLNAFFVAAEKAKDISLASKDDWQ